MRKFNVCLLFLLLLTACARPLTPPERAFAATVHGPSLATAVVRVHDTPLIGAVARIRPPRPATACRERIWPPETGPVATRTAAFVLGSRMFAARDWYRADYLDGYPRTLALPDAMLLAHELTHVWQWQNRAQTGYHPLRALTEQATSDDAYLFDLTDSRAFTAYPFEQQASLVEEFVCCRALDPDGARTERLHALLAPAFPAIERRGAVPPDGARLPWDGAVTRGICG